MMLFILFLLLIFSGPLNADDFSAIAKEAEQNKTSQAQKYLKFAFDAKNLASEISSTYKKDLIDMNKMTLINDSKTLKSSDSPNLIIFISFSMPEKSIVNILQNAKKIHASVIIRGLIHNSFKETFAKMALIVKEAGGGGVELNPLVFRKFNIQKVPAIVVLPSSDTCRLEKICSDNQYDVIHGDIPIDSALKSIRDHGEVSQKNAEKILLNMEESFHV